MHTLTHAAHHMCVHAHMHSTQPSPMPHMHTYIHATHHRHTCAHTDTQAQTHTSLTLLYLGRCFEAPPSVGRPGTLAPAAPHVSFFLLPGMAGDLESLSRGGNGKIDLLCTYSTTWEGAIRIDARLRSGGGPGLPPGDWQGWPLNKCLLSE